MLALAAAVALGGCGGGDDCVLLCPDECSTLCQDVARRVGGCIDGWGVDWAWLDATSQRDFNLSCQQEWDAARTDLEPRQVTEAEARCLAADEDLAELTCDDLRALYLE